MEFFGVTIYVQDTVLVDIVLLFFEKYLSFFDEFHDSVFFLAIRVGITHVIISQILLQF